MENCYNFLDENLQLINDKINIACLQSNRKSDEITLLAVTKTVSIDIILQSIKKGIVQIGENKVQEMLSKYDQLSSIPHETHIIGHLQTNKVNFLPHKISMVQSVDSCKLLDTLDKTYAKENLICKVLLQVNIGDEPAKTGANIADVERLCLYATEKKNIELKGLMCIPPQCKDDMVRKHFEKMYNMFVDIRDKKLDNSNVDILSMGMSSDFDLAIKEGSTMVRVGTSLFGRRKYN